VIWALGKFLSTLWPRLLEVSSHFSDRGKISLLPGLSNIMIQNPPETRVMFLHNLAQRFYRHFPGQRHHQSFKQQGKTTSRTSRGDLDKPHPTLSASDSRHPGMKMSFILKKAQMTPALLLCIMDLTALSLAFWTNKGVARRGVKLNIEAPFFRRKLIGNHKPRIHPNGLLKKFFVFHNRPSYVSQNIFSIVYTHTK